MKKIALISLLIVMLTLSTVFLCACNADMNTYSKRLEKKGYTLEYVFIYGEEYYTVYNRPDGYKLPIWEMCYIKGDDYVVIEKHMTAARAGMSYNRWVVNEEAAKHLGKIVIAGTKQGVRDAFWL